MRQLKAERLVLEPLVESHAPEMFRALVDPITYTFLHDRPPFTEEELRARYRFLEQREAPDGSAKWLSWIVREAGGDAVGYVQAECYPRGVAGLSVVLAPSAWGRGLAREALATVIHELAGRDRVVGFFATVAARNDAALRLFEKLGFRPRARDAFQLRAVDSGDLVYTLGLVAP